MENDSIRPDIETLVAALQPQLVTDRRDFHKYAESGWTEFRTAAAIAKRLTGLGMEVHVGRVVCSPDARMGLPSEETLESHWVRARDEGADPTFLDPMRGGYTGVVGVLRRGDGPTVGLRFDIDALELQESTERSHRPAVEGFASIHRNVCHACGHDGHAAIGLGVAHVLSALKDSLSGTVKLIFQPAEEGVRGARSMVAAGVLDDVDWLLGHHLIAGCAVGEIFPGMGGYAATRKFDVTFHGAPAHAGGSPEGGHNALLAAATAALNLYALPRHREGFTRINVGRLIAGSGRNVIPAEAELVAEVRGETSELCDSMYERAMTVIGAAASMHGCTASVRAMGQAGTSHSDLALAERICAIASALPGTSFHEMQKMGGSEDFTEMMLRVQERGGMATNIGIGADLYGIRHLDRDRDRVLPAHTGTYDIHEDALGFAVHLLSAAVFDVMQAPKIA
jgi:aminobenzoyl-glutamate utilization protein A